METLSDGGSPGSLNPFLPLLAPVLGALFGSFFGALSSYWATGRIRREQERQRKVNLASAFYGEISAVMHLIELKQYKLDYRYLRRKLDSGSDARVSPHYTGGEFFTVYHKNAAEIGLLPEPLPGKIARIYTAFIGLQEDFRTTLSKEWNELPTPTRLLTVDRIMKQLTWLEIEVSGLLPDLKSYMRGT